jgi:hypothetical protein
VETKLAKIKLLPVRFSLGDSEFIVVEIPDGQPNNKVSEVTVVARN